MVTFPHKFGDFIYNCIYPACTLTGISISTFLSSFFFVSSNMINCLFFSSPKCMLAYFHCRGEQGQDVHLIYEKRIVFQVVTNKLFILYKVMGLFRRVTSTYTSGFRDMLPDITVVITSMAFIQNISRFGHNHLVW